MSLPSEAILFNDGNEVCKVFVNIGWVFDEKRLPRCLQEGIDDHQRYHNTSIGEWDSALMYGKMYTKQELIDIHHGRK